MNSDIYCIQEVTHSAAYPSIDTLVSLMGSDAWAGSLVPSVTNDCELRQGIIYKKSRVQLVGATLLNSGDAAQGNSYYYNWSSGRYPALYHVNLVAGNSAVPLSLVNIHAKAEDGNAMSYTRRLGASEGLKAILDGSIYQAENLVVIGDFNDYLNGTTSNACACTVSPYQNFMDDFDHYNGVTNSITDANTSWGIHPLIENIIISDELFGNYIANSAAQELSVYQNTNNYFNTTSDHLPVSARFQFAMLDNPEFSSSNASSWRVYPNPVKDVLQFDALGLANDLPTAIYDLTGRQIRCEKINANAVGVAHLPNGVYILKVGSRSSRFVKS
jgi:endonuclease/exonuclease/phosphatase family metal-dependent hydrolase